MIRFDDDFVTRGSITMSGSDVFESEGSVTRGSITMSGSDVFESL